MAVELTPGQWTITHKISTPDAGVIHQTQDTVCISGDLAVVTLEKILAELDWGECKSSNLELTPTTGRADLTCIYPDEGNVRADGTVSATFSGEAFAMETKMLGIGEVKQEVWHNAVGTRLGNCTD